MDYLISEKTKHRQETGSTPIKNTVYCTDRLENFTRLRTVSGTNRGSTLDCKLQSLLFITQHEMHTVGIHFRRKHDICHDAPSTWHSLHVTTFQSHRPDYITLSHQKLLPAPRYNSRFVEFSTWELHIRFKNHIKNVDKSPIQPCQLHHVQSPETNWTSEAANASSTGNTWKATSAHDMHRQKSKPLKAYSHWLMASPTQRLTIRIRQKKVE